MGGFSKRIFHKIDGIPEKARKAKFTIGENTAIIKKRKLYNKVKWTPEQKKEFDSFWENYGGMKPYWHKLYQSMNGVFDVRYFPEKLYTTKLEPLLNPWIYQQLFSDKSLIKILWGDIENAYIPKCYLTCINGSFFDSNNEGVSLQQAVKLLYSIKKCILKPTIDTGSGRGIRILDCHEGIDLISNKKITEIISCYHEDFVIQEIIINNDAIKALNPTSLNTIRAITYRVESDIRCVPLILRIGVGDSTVDNIHAGGICVGVNFDGTLKEYAYKLGWGDDYMAFSKHPTTKIVFKDYYIGDIPRLIETAKKLHEKVPHLGIISWDLTINNDNQIVLIEANCAGQSVWFPQIIHAKPIFGENTEYFLEMLVKKVRNE